MYIAGLYVLKLSNPTMLSLQTSHDFVCIHYAHMV